MTKKECKMTIELESVYDNILLYGRNLKLNELQAIMEELLVLVGEKDFIFYFCMRYKYEIIPYDINIKVDYVIDLDTHTINKPKY